MHVFSKFVMEPLLANGDNFIYFKIAVYPKRYTFGSAVDATKFDLIRVDTYDLYGLGNAPTMEKDAKEFIRRLLNTRIKYFANLPAEIFFKGNSEDVWRILYNATHANPRKLGTLLSTAINGVRDTDRRLSKNLIERTCQIHYEERVEPFFLAKRIADLGLEEELDSKQLQELLDVLINRAVSLTKMNETTLQQSLRVSEGGVPSSHFHVRQDLEHWLATLEMNAFVTKYNERSENGVDFNVYAFDFGLCRQRKIMYADGQVPQLSKLLIAPMLDFSSALESFFYNNVDDTLTCGRCKYRALPEEKVFIERHGRICPKCHEGKMTEILPQKAAQPAPKEDRPKLSKLDSKIVATLGHLEK